MNDKERKSWGGIKFNRQGEKKHAISVTISSQLDVKLSLFFFIINMSLSKVNLKVKMFKETAVYRCVLCHSSASGWQYCSVSFCGAALT